MDKKRIRKAVLKNRSSLSSVERREKDSLISKHLESLPLFQKVTNILIYFSFNDEVGTHKIIEKWMKRKNFFLPRLVSGGTFLALPFASFENLEPNSFGIFEPKLPLEKDESKTKLDLIILPGVAFDRKGNRIGMGKGYYDRFLVSQKGVPLVALAYSEQILDQLPCKPYDEPVDMIVTEKEVIRCKS